MSDKELALETIRNLPEESSLEEISSRLEYLSAIRKGLDDVERGDVIPHDEVKRQISGRYWQKHQEKFTFFS